MTGLFTVLVEGDDHNEPIADAVRGILDGHIVLERAVAERNRYPAINLLRSVSRTMPDCNREGENALVNRARNLLSTYENMAELIRIGAYKQGSDPAVDEAIHYNDALEAFLGQKKDEISHLAEGYSQLAALLGMADPTLEAAAAQAAPEDIQMGGLAAAQTAMPEDGLAPAQAPGQTAAQAAQECRPAERDFKKRRDRMAAALNLAQAKTAAPGQAE